MDGIVYVIKTKNNFPRVVAEIYTSNELLTEYEVNLNEDYEKLGLSFIQDYSNSLAGAFDQVVADIKSEGLTYEAFSLRLELITNILTTKTRCDLYLERMDVVE